MALLKICCILFFCILLLGVKRISSEGSETNKESEEKSDETGMDSQGIYDFMISSKALTTIDFHGSDLIIYEHPHNIPADKIHPDNRFYVMPLVEIDAKSLSVRHSWLIDAYRLDFTVILWADELKTAVIDDLEKLYAEQEDTKRLTMNQIQMIPMEEVRLIWNSEVPLPDGIWLSRDWIPFSRNPHRLDFSFMCELEDTCQKLKTEMETHPNEFRKLNLEFTTTVKSSASKEIRITGSTLTTSETFRDLQTNDKFPGGEEGIRYMTAEDIQSLSLEVTENYVATTVTDAEYVPTQQSISIAELIYNRLASTKVSTSTLSEKAWNSLKWEPDFARPDRVTSQLNDITNVVQAQNGTKYLKIDEKAFDNADHNYAYATEFGKMQNYKSTSGSSRSSNRGCDSSSSSTSASVSGGGWFFRVGASASHSQSKRSCHSLFNAKSSRSSSSFYGENSNTDVAKTDVKRAGLSNWKVSGEDFNNYMSDQSSYIEFDGEKFIHKPMDLYKMTMSELTENVNIATTDMQVQKMQKIYHIKVSISNEITAVYQNELDKIKETIKYLDGNMTLRDSETKKELKQELLGQKTELKEELVGQKTELKEELAGQRAELEGELANVRQAVLRQHDAVIEIEETMHMNLSYINDNIEDLQKDVDEHAENFRKLGSGDISFTARLTSNRQHSHNNIIVFDTTHINLNNCYDTSTGKFTAPANGLYLFYFSLYIDGSTSRRFVNIYVDDTKVLDTTDFGTNFNGGYYSVSSNRVRISTPSKIQTPSVTFQLQLNQGQVVYLKLISSGSINMYFSWFGGHLIKTL